jgi:hypothetical protein
MDIGVLALVGTRKGLFLLSGHNNLWQQNHCGVG